jgi:drug/metabolite transporter (DMT)-like permease
MPLLTPTHHRIASWITQRLHRRTAHLSPTTRALLWAASAGLIFNLLNAVMRGLSQHVHPFQAQFLRYVFGLVILLPLVVRHGMAAYRPKSLGGQFTRGALHTVGLFFWFAALPKIALADMTAIGFTTPLFVMLGAYLFLHEPMRWERWVATALGFGGVLIVVGPQFAMQGTGSGWYHLVMLASAPLFAASFLVTKALTRYETTGTILVWQGITVTLFSLPMALLHWSAVSAWHWAGFLLCGILGTAAHFCLTRSFKRADISATQSLKFLELVWSALLGWLLFADVPTLNAIMGGVVISAATLWVARLEAR